MIVMQQTKLLDLCNYVMHSIFQFCRCVMPLVLWLVLIASKLEWCDILASNLHVFGPNTDQFIAVKHAGVTRSFCARIDRNPHCIPLHSSNILI